jgi:microcin C transport system substrate-binding protein
MPRVRTFATLSLSAVLLVVLGCSGQKDADEPKAPPVSSPAPVPVAKAAAPDPVVTAEQGGEGFTGAGWQTSTNFDLIGDSRAVKGGTFREYIPQFPKTFRMAGPESSTGTVYLLGNCIYETLLMLHPTTLEYIPSLATHWQISDDKRTFRFRVNPNARFSNGEPVTAEDVVASWTFITDKTLQDPSRNAQFAKFEVPVAESKYIVSVKASKPDWRNLKDFATVLLIYPASSLKGLSGAEYLKKFNYALLPGSGPYSLSADDVKKQQSLALRRRKDYWGEKERGNVGLNNFDEIRLLATTEQAIAFEMFKKGDLDIFYVNRSQWWFQEMDIDAVQRGLLQKVKVFNDKTPPWQGFAMNTRRPPLDDIRVRKALTLLLDRKKIIEQLYRNEYIPLNTYFPQKGYQNPGNPENPYAPQEALQILAEAGWSGRDAQGRLTKAGKPLALRILYDGPAIERVLTVYQEDLKKVGITLDLELVSFETRVQLTRADRQFDMAYVGLGLPVLPDPEPDWHPRLADQKDNGNITGFRDPKMVDLMAKYSASFDAKTRISVIRELDGVMTGQYQYVLAWTAPSMRLAFWNRFGQPAGYLTRTGDYMGDLSFGAGAERLWWVDPAKEAQVKKAMTDPSLKLEIRPAEDKYWFSHKDAPKSQ